jgi:predicted Ser/Thr protein kinase
VTGDCRAHGNEHGHGEGRGVQPLTSDDPAEVGGYRLRARLGAGGMGRVYLAATPAGRTVALKVVRREFDEDPEFRTRFRREIQAAQRVNGLYTAQLVDADPEATPPWLVTTYVPGPSLQEAVERHGPMPEAMVFRLIAGVAEALRAIHAADVVHRDLKPSNVLLAQDGPRVIDFGIAQAQEATSLTRSGIMMGSPDFLAPEQVAELPITPAIDVFALGSLAVYAATGRPPFRGGSLVAVAHRVAYEPPDLTGCPAQLLTLIEACLEKRAKDRPAPSRIIEFCMARAAETPESGQTWLAWGEADAAADPAALTTAQAPGAAAVAAGSPGGAGSGSSESGGSGSGGTGSGGTGYGSTGQAELPRLRVPARLAIAAALAGVAVGAVALAGHLATASNAAAGQAPGPGAGARPPASAAPRSTEVAALPSVTRGAGPAASRSPASGAAASPSPAVRAHQAKPVVLLSQGRPVFASSSQGAHWAAANAVDGDLTTRWSSAWSDPQWLEVDLGAVYDIHSVVLYWENAYATAFQLQVSANGSTWSDLYPALSGYAGEQTIPVSGSGRYVRMYGTQRATSYGYSLWEFQVFGN